MGKIQRAIISLSDKTGILDFARELDAFRKLRGPGPAAAAWTDWFALPALLLVVPVSLAQAPTQAPPPADPNDAKVTEVLNAWEKAMTAAEATCSRRKFLFRPLGALLRKTQ